MVRSSVGEVRVRATLTNAFDEALVRRGLLRPEEMRTFEADALVDTGAVRTILPPDVVARLGLVARGHRRAGYFARRPAILARTQPVTLGPHGPGTRAERLCPAA